MKVYRLEKTIENEKLDLELAIGNLRKEKEHLSQSLQRRKELAVQLNENLYIEEIIEDLCQERSSNEVDATIKDILEKNLTLQEEVRKLKREKEI